MREERLRSLNRLLLPFLRSAREQRRLLRLAGRPPARILHVDQARDYTVTVIVYTLPLGNPLVAAIYTSAQRSRPLAPSQLRRRLQRLRDAVARLRGRLYNQADIVYAIHVPAGATRGAKRLARSLGVNLAATTEKLLASLARYIATRHQRLAAKLRGKRVWGPVPLLLHALAHLAKELGAPDADPPPLHITLKLAQEGGTIPA